MFTEKCVLIREWFVALSGVYNIYIYIHRRESILLHYGTVLQHYMRFMTFVMVLTYKVGLHVVLYNIT